MGLRALVFLAGLLLVVAGVGLWVVSMLLTVPVLLAGLWVWSWEFAWARSLMHSFRRSVRGRLRRARARPARWCGVTAVTLVVTGAAYWAFAEYAPV